MIPALFWGFVQLFMAIFSVAGLAVGAMGGNAQRRSISMLGNGNNLQLEMQTQKQVRWQQSREPRFPQRGLGSWHVLSRPTHHWQQGHDQ